ncbi:MAG: DUF3194 domain-containing protein [Desulfurococcaceae archaeon]|nr:DUF3194 domain-containing protein [Desulfurococcaceae archaeon]
MKKKYVINLGINLNSLTEAFLEELVIKVNEFIRRSIVSKINLGRDLEVNTSITVELGNSLTCDVSVELLSSKPIPIEYEVIIDKIIDDAFRLLEDMLLEVGSNDSGFKH